MSKTDGMELTAKNDFYISFSFSMTWSITKFHSQHFRHTLLILKEMKTYVSGNKKIIFNLKKEI
jgi:hypothetical protein